ncbi:MAG: 16S rRNA (adenine(1518)-N(6)/adenine(1519)-N(6))-dimethyltransferase RsmA [Anaerolineae bacterium]|nr:16S rRNA (adenine(1518)-N(6)/adenine(1519)-N(6))-dimethyltransferase RsmA [Anaerolineae bacterium]
MGIMNPKLLLEDHGIAPKKSLGQNFLQDPNTLDKIVAAAELLPTDTVLEIGPGTGAMTTRLAKAAERVVAVEIDSRLEPVLRAALAAERLSNVSLLFADILQVNVASLMADPPYVVVANLPYYITSAILRHLLEARHRPRRLVLMVQLEVAERLTAAPGDMSLLTVSAQFYAKPQMIGRLKPSVFWPRPDVDSAVVRLDTYAAPPVDVPDVATFFKVVRAGFAQKRKQLKNAFAEGVGLSHADAAIMLELASIDPKRRAETLSLGEWAALARAFVTLR